MSIHLIGFLLKLCIVKFFGYIFLSIFDVFFFLFILNSLGDLMLLNAICVYVCNTHRKRYSQAKRNEIKDRRIAGNDVDGDNDDDGCVYMQF